MSPKKVGPIAYLPVNGSKKYKKPAGWKGTPVDRKGLFMNEEYPFYQDYLKIMVWLPGHLLNLINNRKRMFPVTYHTSESVLSENETLIWLGHASFFLRINDINILIDPHFNHTFIHKRHSDNPIPPEVFKNIHYILLSHDHADHCDKQSLQLLITNNPEVTFITGLNMDTLIQSFVKNKVKTITADWYEEIAIHSFARITFVPSRHYSKRIFQKFNFRLWGGFVISYKNLSGDVKTIYYGGDSGYGNHFKVIKHLFNPQIAILPIGSYMPRWFMAPNHMSPEEALEAFDDCGARLIIPMHYGTFNLSNESMTTPSKTLLQNKSAYDICDLKIGQACKITGLI